MPRNLALRAKNPVAILPRYCRKQIGLVAALLVCAFNVWAKVHYVDVNGTNARPPYTNWATAAAVIQDAVDTTAIATGKDGAHIYTAYGKQVDGVDRLLLAEFHDDGVGNLIERSQSRSLFHRGSRPPCPSSLSPTTERFTSSTTRSPAPTDCSMCA